MSCCSKGYCDFKFPDGPPLLDNSVENLQATYQFLPYGSLLKEGEVVRIWLQSGKTQTVIIEEKIPLEVLDYGFRPLAALEAKPDEFGHYQVPQARHFPWQLIAFDSGFDFEDMMRWRTHPLCNPQQPPVLMVYRHPAKAKFSLKAWWLRLLYKIRNV